ncbi:MAG TPA: IPExxxVDY family protein [Bacteroidales bacterium]|nr:IPExxxVDY family protein [Bacteroidales bacterium]
MRSQVKKTRHKLNVSYDSSDILLGLVTAEADYKISLLLNNILNIKLKSLNPVSSEPQFDGTDLYTRFHYSPEYNDLIYYLVSNKSNRLPLNRKFPNIDYFLFIKNISSTSDVDEIIRKTRDLKEITAVFQLDYDFLLEEKVLL